MIPRIVAIKKYPNLIPNERNENSIAFVAARDAKIVVNGIIGETAKELLVPCNGHVYFIKTECIIVGELIKVSKEYVYTFSNLRQARALCEKRNLVLSVGETLAQNKSYNRLKEKYCKLKGYKDVTIPGGALPLHYTDERVIRLNETHFCVVTK